MGSVIYTPEQVGTPRNAPDVNAIFDAFEGQSALINRDNFRKNGMNARVMTNGHGAASTMPIRLFAGNPVGAPNPFVSVGTFATPTVNGVPMRVLGPISVPLNSVLRLRARMFFETIVAPAPNMGVPAGVTAFVRLRVITNGGASIFDMAIRQESPVGGIISSTGKVRDGEHLSLTTMTAISNPASGLGPGPDVFPGSVVDQFIDEVHLQIDAQPIGSTVLLGNAMLLGTLFHRIQPLLILGH